MTNKEKSQIEQNLYDNHYIVILDGFSEELRKDLLSEIFKYTESMEDKSQNFDFRFGHYEFTVLSDEEKQNYLKQYYLYEFTDKIIYISDRDQFGSLFNYVKTGLLSYDEMASAIILGNTTLR